jgi:PIN domain nuclease of toxin-antitoxin system
MKILLDTNVFLWLFLLPSRISGDVETLLKNPNNEISLSAVSAWEIAIKYGINKLQLPAAPEIYVPDRMKRANFKELVITSEHSLATASLPRIHKDRFDRLLVAQANAENLTILSADKIFARYHVKFIDSETYKI